MDKTALTDDETVRHRDPNELFRDWMADAETNEINDPGAMSLATVDGDGLPDVRMVLLKEHDDRGFVFYTNFESRKGQEILAHRKAALCLHWKSLRRQVRVRGEVEIVTDAEADRYFASRPKGSRIGARASDQSRPLDSRATLETRVRDLEARYADGEVPRPSNWSGFRVVPSEIEFWRDGEFRLHDRFRFTRVGQGWDAVRLYP
jgi:pyridoxamine 5'-phosphate oxidase